MSNSTLYKCCLQKIAINLRDKIYKSCHENPFSVMPSKIVNDIMSAAVDYQHANGFRVEDLKQLLTSGNLRELKICEMGEQDLIKTLWIVIKIIHFLNMGCQKLEIFHLSWTMRCYRAWLASDESVARTRSEVYASRLRSGISVALEHLFGNAHNLEDLHCSFSFDLKALRNCRKLRRLRLHFVPQQHWYEFLEEEENHFQIHKYLQLFTVCLMKNINKIPYTDIVTILRHCPELTSLGYIESSGALSRLHRIDELPYGLKLQHCFWRDIEYDKLEGLSNDDLDPHRVEKAVLNYPMIVELDFDGCRIRSMPCLKSLKNLVYLNIAFDDIDCGNTFNDVLQVIGANLKHLCVKTSISIDLGLLLQNCHNLESLRIDLDEFTEFGNLSVNLPNLKRLAFYYRYDNGARFLNLLYDCNQLTELFIIHAHYFDDQTLCRFLEKNSLSNLKMAGLLGCGLTEHGFRKLLLIASQLEEIRIYAVDYSREHFERIIIEMGHKTLCNDDVFLSWKEFFERKQHDLY